MMIQPFQSFDAPGAVAETGPRVAALRALMGKAKLDAVLIPHADEYNNEYLPACAERLAFMTGFTGSAGFAAVTVKAAAVFVDGRYAVQAPAEVDGAIFAIKGVPSVDLAPWLVMHLKAGAKVGFDPRLHSLGEVEQLSARLAERQIKLKPTPRNLVDAVWGHERPAPPASAITFHHVELAGRAAIEKIADVQKVLREAKQDAVVLTAPDSICWLFNIRGSDVAHNPVVLATAIVTANGKPQLFVAADRLQGAAKAQVGGVAKVRPPHEFGLALKDLKAAGKVVRVSPGLSWAYAQALGGLKRIKRAPDPCTEPKALKTTAELAGARAAHVRDGVAVARFLSWLDEPGKSGSVLPDEITAVQRLEDFRRETGALREVSFPTISGSGPHGAIVHYRVTTKTNRRLQAGELFLIDSGGQYEDGTTDITRTVAIGVPSEEMRARFTLVLKGMIAISTARFPRGTRGIDLDPLARRALWAAGLNYDHGTGHGVGSYLNVHEGPQSISRAGMAELKPGMICSNEPGYYKQGAYGVRIENLIVVTPPEDVGGDQPVLGFETLTLAPIDRQLIVVEMLSGDERAWLNAYHARVWQTLGPLVPGDVRGWLKGVTGAI